MAKSRVGRDGVAQFAAVTADRMQLARLHRLRGRLGHNLVLDVFYGDRPDGMSYLTVYPAGQRQAAVWGQPKGVEEEGPEDVHVEFLDGDLWDVPEPA
jgi:hypothetical protein